MDGIQKYSQNNSNSGGIQLIRVGNEMICDTCIKDTGKIQVIRKGYKQYGPKSSNSVWLQATVVEYKRYGWNTSNTMAYKLY